MDTNIIVDVIVRPGITPPLPPPSVQPFPFLTSLYSDYGNSPVACNVDGTIIWGNVSDSTNTNLAAIYKDGLWSFLPGISGGQATVSGCTPDGTKGFGVSDPYGHNGALYWDENKIAHSLGEPNSRQLYNLIQCNADCSLIVGNWNALNFHPVGYLFSPTASPIPIVSIDPVNLVNPYIGYASIDCLTLSGQCSDGVSTFIATIWKNQVPSALPNPYGQYNSTVTGMSPDGSVILGCCFDGSGNQIYGWWVNKVFTKAQNPDPIATNNFYLSSVSPKNNYVLGFATINGIQNEKVLWRLDGSFQVYPEPPGSPSGFVGNIMMDLTENYFIGGTYNSGYSFCAAVWTVGGTGNLLPDATGSSSVGFFSPDGSVIIGVDIPLSIPNPNQTVQSTVVWSKVPYPKPIPFQRTNFLSPPVGTTSLDFIACSANGTFVVANGTTSSAVPFVVLWASGTTIVLPDLYTSANGSFATGMSADGTIIYGTSDDPDNPGQSKPVKWVNNTISAYDFDTTLYTYVQFANAIDVDVPYVGGVDLISGHYIIYSVSLTNPPVPLEVLSGQTDAQIGYFLNSVSADGKTVVGVCGSVPVKWTNGTPVAFSISTPGDICTGASIAQVTPDGSKGYWGSANVPSALPYGTQPCIWNSDGSVMTLLNTSFPSGLYGLLSRGMSLDGKFFAGVALNSSSEWAVYWDQENIMRPLPFLDNTYQTAQAGCITPDNLFFGGFSRDSTGAERPVIWSRLGGNLYVLPAPVNANPRYVLGFSRDGAIAFGGGNTIDTNLPIIVYWK